MSLAWFGWLDWSDRKLFSWLSLLFFFRLLSLLLSLLFLLRFLGHIWRNLGKERGLPSAFRLLFLLGSYLLFLLWLQILGRDLPGLTRLPGLIIVFTSDLASSVVLGLDLFGLMLLVRVRLLSNWFLN